MSDDRPTPKPRRKRSNSSLRVIVEENRMLFGSLSRVLQKLARSVVQLRRHEHKQNNALTAVNLKLDMIMHHLGIPPLVMPETEEPVILDEDATTDGTDTRR